MCRLYGLRANEPTKVNCSLVFAQNALMQQSRADETGRNHTDGWGIVIYQGSEPIVQKKATPAFEDALFSMTAESSFSTTIVAHVRRATVGKNSDENTHPFVCGRWSFAHNGTITGFESIEEIMVSETDADLQRHRRGQTDSEQYFYWLLTRLKALGLDDYPRDPQQANAWIDTLADCVSMLSQRCEAAAPKEIPRLNFILANHEILFACRWNHTLHWVERNGIYDCEICGIPHIHHDTSVNHHAVAIASEPVTHEHWSLMPNFSLMFVSPGVRCQIHPVRQEAGHLDAG